MFQRQIGGHGMAAPTLIVALITITASIRLGLIRINASYRNAVKMLLSPTHFRLNILLSVLLIMLAPTSRARAYLVCFLNKSYSSLKTKSISTKFAEKI